MVNSPSSKLRSTSKNGLSTPSASSENESRQSASSGTTMAQVVATFKKSLKAGADWQEDDLLDVVYWGRQVVGAIVGILWGIIPVYGLIGIGVYLAITTALVHLYVTAYQRQDEERFGGFWELAKEGFGSSFATFLVCWILVYTAVHFAS